MSTRIVVDRQNELKEVRIADFPPLPTPVPQLARLVSWLFHPVFVPVYVVAFMLYLHPWLFAGFNSWQKSKTLMMAVLMYSFFPLVTVGLLRGLNLISSVYLRTQRDRVIPIIASMIWYFWLWYVWYNMGKVQDAVEMPAQAVQFAFAVFMSSILALMMNIRMKISLHAIAMGLVFCFFLVLAFSQSVNFGIFLSVVIFITGLVTTARLIASDHSTQEVYMGLATGIVSMLLAIWWDRFF